MQEQPFWYSCSFVYNKFGNLFLHNTVGKKVFCIAGKRTEQAMRSARSMWQENHLLNRQCFCFYWWCAAGGNCFIPQNLACLQYEIHWTFTMKSTRTSSATIQLNTLEINLPTIKSKHKSYSKIFNSTIHARYKPAISSSSNLNQTKETTFQIIHFTQKVILFQLLLLYFNE